MNYNYKMVGGNSSKTTAVMINQKPDASVDASLDKEEGNALDKYSISLKVASSLSQFIDEKRGSVLEKIEEDLGVRIIFPSSENEELIIIEGTSLNSVTTASERIQFIIKEASKSLALPYTHFVSLPLAVHPELVNKLVNFQNSISGIHDLNPDLVELGIDKSIFIKPKTVHLTVLMLKLWSKERLDDAVKIFEDIRGELMDALDGRAVSIRLKGLDCMEGSFDKARVLYAPVEVVGGEDRLLQACKVITEAFMKSGIIHGKDVKRALKLHATVMNVSHRDRKKMRRRPDSFDARGVMEKYGSEDWGEYLIRQVHLSEMFVFNEDGYYHCCASIPLPQKD